MIGVAAIGLITIANLRGLREAGNIFAAPTYLFVGSALLMIAVGVVPDRRPRRGRGRTRPTDRQPGSARRSSRSRILLLLRAFAAGAVALTGTEAIATGVPAFKPPESKNAATTLAVMAALLGVLFIGITFLAVNFAIIPIDFPEKQTVIAQVARDGLRRRRSRSTCSRPSRRCCCSWPRTPASTPSRGCWRSWPATATCRASSRCAATGSRSRTGSSSSASLAAALIVIFRGSRPTCSIPLYAVGVFIDFTISQTGMIRHWLRERPPGWRRRLAINAFGAALTGDRRGHRDRA